MDLARVRLGWQVPDGSIFADKDLCAFLVEKKQGEQQQKPSEGRFICAAWPFIGEVKKAFSCEDLLLFSAQGDPLGFIFEHRKRSCGAEGMCAPTPTDLFEPIVLAAQSELL
jgi:hypothetical protein